MLDTRKFTSSETIAVQEIQLTSPLWKQIQVDWQTNRQHDFTKRSGLDLLFFSDGLHALILHRIAYKLHHWGIAFLPRLISQVNRFLTGTEIHPGATLEPGVFIAHGMGIVIGETAIVGKGSIIYQDVTLGGTGKETGKRHPTLGKNVVVEPGAKVLGNICIGDDVRIGAGAVVLRHAPNRSIVVGVPGRVIYRKTDAEEGLNNELQPDLEAQVIQILFERIKFLESQIEPFKKVNSSQSNKSEEITDSSRLTSNLIVENFLDGAGI